MRTQGHPNPGLNPGEIPLPNGVRRVRKIIRVSGKEIHLIGAMTIKHLEEKLKAELICTEPLPHMGEPLHMLCWDNDWEEKGLPVNPIATMLYHQNRAPSDRERVHGDVAIVLEQDFFLPQRRGLTKE